MNDLTPFQQMAASTAVVEMFEEKHFSICKLEAIAETVGRKSECAGRDYAALRTLHCMDWKKMPPGLPAFVREKCLEILGMPADVLDVVAKVVPDRQEPRQPEPEQKPALKLAFWRKAG